MSDRSNYLDPLDHACIHHPDRITRDACYCCGRYICQECSSRTKTAQLVCSEACRDRLLEREKETEEFNRFPGWPTRIWTSLFLLLLLSSLGGIAGCHFGIRMIARARLSVPTSWVVLKGVTCAGAIVGVGSALVFLYRYYRRKL
jgi:hypothetical protein